MMTTEGPPRVGADAELKTIFWSVPALYFRVKGDGTIVDFRPGRADDLHLLPEWFFGRRISELLPEPVGRQVAEAIGATIEKRTATTVEYPLTVPSGEKRFEAHLVPYAANQAVMVVRDITDQHRALQAVHQARADLETQVVARTAAFEQATAAARESEERFRALAENSPDVIMRFDRACRHLYVNAPVEAQTGIPARDFIGKTHRQLGFPEALCELWEGAITRVFTTGQTQRVEFELPTHIWIDWLLVPELAADRSVAAVMTAARDISAHKHAEEALKRRVAERTAELEAANTALHADIVERRQTEEQLRQALAWQEGIFEGSRDATFISDAGSQFTAVNSAACELTGYSRDELLRMRIPDLHDGIDLHAYQAFHDRILAGEEIVSEAKIQRKDGTKVDTEFNNRRIVVAGLAHMHTSARDISDRKRVEAARRESEMHFRTLAETTGLGILIVQDEHFIYANPAAERITGYTARELGGILFWELVHPDYRELVRQRAAARLAGARDLPTRYEIKAIVKGGAERWFSLTSGATVLGGKPALVASITDVTDERGLRDVQSALYEISEAAQTAGTLDDLYRAIHAIIGRLMNAKNLYIALHDPTTNLISFPYFVDEVDTTPEPFPPGPGMTSYVIRSGRPLLATPGVLSELEARGEIVRLGADSIDWLGVPLKVQDKIIGVLAVQSYVGNVRYSEADKEVLSYVSAQVAQAIERKRAEEALRESEETARVLLNAPSDVALLVDTLGRVLAANENAAKRMGTTDEAITGHSLYDHLDPAVAAIRRARVEETVRSGTAIQWEDERRGVRFANTAYPIFDAQGRVARVAILAHDITEEGRLREVQAAIYEISEATQTTGNLDDLYRAIHAIIGRLMNAKNLYIALHDPTTNLISFPYFVDEVDTTPEPFPFGQGMTSYVIRSGRPLLGTRAVLSELEARGEAKRLGADSVDWLGVPLKVQDKIIGVLAVQSYVGNVRYSEADKEVLSYVSAQVAQAIERKRAEEALRESEARFRRSIEEFSDGFALIDEQGNVIEWNAALERIHGITREEALGEPLWDVEWRLYLPERRTPERYEFNKRSILHTIQTGKLPLLPDQVDTVSVDGRRRTVSQSVFVITTQKGFRVGIVTRDITGLIELEGQLRQAQKMDAVGRLAGGIAHDFNNVLQTLLSLSQALTGQLDEPERFTATMRDLQEQVKRGAALTRQLLLFSRSEPPRLERLDLNEVVKQSSRMIGRLLRENISLTLDLAERPIPVDGDAGQFEQVLINLVVNGADAMPEGGRLVIRTHLAENAATLEVSDTGSGMSDEVKARIFEPFFTTKEASKGTGLGLSVVHGIITGHGGHIEVQSVVGQGSTFRLVLPAAASEADPTPLPIAEPSVGIAIGGGERVLVVEDEAGAREGLVQVVTMLGYHVTAVGNGSEAHALPTEPGFDVLLTDYLLPDALGTDLAVQLKSRWPRVKVVLMSGYAEDEALRRRIAKGAVRFLQKPFDMEVLARELRAALEE